MAISTAIAVAAALAQLSTATVNAPNGAYNFEGNASVVTCSTTTIDKPHQNGTLNAFSNDPASEKALLAVGWNPEKEQPLWAFEGAGAVSGMGGFINEAERQALLRQSVVWLHQDTGNGKPTAKPTAKISSWYTQDGEASTSFPYLKGYRQHFQYCAAK